MEEYYQNENIYDISFVSPNGSHMDTSIYPDFLR